jgi:hypothetical protein
MKDPNGKVVVFQWVVIAVLVIGAGIGGYMLYSKNTDLQAQLDSQSGNLSSLRSQLEQAKADKTPAANESALPAASSNVSPSATPTPTATPKTTPVPTKTPVQ